MSTELVEIQQENVLTVFSTVNGLDPVIIEIKSLVDEFEHDLSTGAGRKRTASLANKVAKSKVYMDGLGKDLVADWKSKAKVVDAERKRMRETLDELKQVARKPLTDWEAEQAAIEAEKLKKEQAEAMAKEFSSDHEIALLLDEKFDRDIAEAKAMLEQARIDREEEMKHQAAEAARIQAEQKAAAEAERVKREKQEALDRVFEAKIRAERAEQEAIAEKERMRFVAEQAEQGRIKAEQQAKQDAIDAQNNARLEAERAERRRVDAEQQAIRNAEIAAQNARDAEIRRQQDEADLIQRAKAAREADLDNRHAKNVAAKNAIVKLGFNPDGATALVKAIAKGLIPGVSISY